jgi:transcriptional regulator with XRE-family HTH domain
VFRILVVKHLTVRYSEHVTRPHTHSPAAVEAAQLLGSRIRLGRLERRWTAADLAERVGTSRGTIWKIEHGDLTVSIGAVFEAAATVGVSLFHDDASRRLLERRRIEDRLALLPQRARTPVDVDDDF